MKKLYFIIATLLLTINVAADTIPVVPAKFIDILPADVVVYRIHLETGKIQYIREIIMLNGDICRTVVHDQISDDAYVCGKHQGQRFIKH